ncbi:MAG: glycosyltransferase [bacterium]|nr:glycosyltransferase [bacterium]
MGNSKTKIIFIVWGKEMQLSNNLGQALGVEVRQIYFKKIGSYNLPVIFRYILQGAETLLILIEKRPEVVIVQNPPVFAPLTVLLYCKLSGAKLVIDSHTAAFLDDKWKRFYGLFKFAAKRAILNSCHNYKNLEILKSWGVEPAMVMQFFNPSFDLDKLNLPMRDEKIAQAVKASNLPIMMVNRFANDDDWQTVIKTAELMSEADFFITGDFKQAGIDEKKLPNNVFLTGYLRHEEFLKLTWRSRVILAFSLRLDTVLWSIREIMALSKPFVTTDSEVLRHYFGEIGLFTKSDAEELKQKIEQAIKNENEIKNKIKIFLAKDKIRWQNEILEYKKHLNN